MADRQHRDDDLAQRRAGRAARERAEAERAAAPGRTVLARLTGAHTDERAWRIGAQGEALVAVQLNKLRKRDPRWRLLHSVPVGRNGADIDHVVIGPAGVFALNAKHHPHARIWVAGDTLMVNGTRQPYIRNSRYEAVRAGRLLSTACGFPVPVTGVVVPVGARSVTVRKPADDVRVVNRGRLRRWLRGQPELLPEEAIDAVFTQARRSATWAG